MKQPDFLYKGDTIDRIAPSFGITTEPYITRFKNALDVFKKLGYSLRLGKNVYRADGLASSASPKERAEEFRTAYFSDSKLLLSVGGGEREVDRLPYLDFKKIKEAKPKWFLGSSDNTNLAFTLTTIAGVMSIYSSNAPSYFSFPLCYAEKDAIRRLSGEKEYKGYSYFSPPFETNNPLEPLHLTEKKIITPIHYQSEVKGTRIGGCLDCLLTLCGTRFDQRKEFQSKHKEGLIFYLESCDLNPLAIYRGLIQLREAGWFNNTNRFLFGRPLCQKQEILSIDSKKAIFTALEGFHKPRLLDVDLGHIPPSLPFKNGAEAKVSLNREKNIIIQYRE